MLGDSSCSVVYYMFHCDVHLHFVELNEGLLVKMLQYHLVSVSGRGKFYVFDQGGAVHVKVAVYSLPSPVVIYIYIYVGRWIAFSYTHIGTSTRCHKVKSCQNKETD